MDISLSRAGEEKAGICVGLRRIDLSADQSHLIEPRFDEFKSASEKALALGDLSAGNEMSLAPFREALGSTKVIVAGGYGPDNFSQGIESGAHDLVAFGRFFV
jgi:2,4-dienoyl-CoA reductase-like NADH-dependent reductase (Old Yellow Enzyme family)